MKKKMIYILAVAFIVILVFIIKFTIDCFIIGSGGFFNFPIGKEKMETIFLKDQEILIIVTNYLANSDYDSVYIPTTMESGKMSIAGKETTIEDDEIIHAINQLRNKGYHVIGKEKNAIYFQRWSNLDNGHGMVYSINGNKPTLQFLTKLEPLPAQNWYYYEEDYNEWRIRNNGIPSYIIGEWNIQYAKTRGAGENYPLQELYGTSIENGGKLTFYADGTFSRYVGITTNQSDKYEGTYILHYDDKILLKYKDGTISTVQYLPTSQEMVYYTWDANQTPIDEYYTKQQ